jgi:hypothetical protein
MTSGEEVRQILCLIGLLVIPGVFGGLLAWILDNQDV